MGPDTYDAKKWDDKIRERNPFVAGMDGKIVGFAELEDDGHIDHFYVHHEWQRRGVGSALFEALQEEAFERNISMLFTEASVTSMPFFLSRGFEIWEERAPIICGTPAKQYSIQKLLAGNPRNKH